MVTADDVEDELFLERLHGFIEEDTARDHLFNEGFQFCFHSFLTKASPEIATLAHSRRSAVAWLLDLRSMEGERGGRRKLSTIYQATFLV